MGTKKDLAPLVRDVIAQAQPGVLLDAFAGMCSVAEELAGSRQIWTNDIQVFAAETGRALFTSSDEPIDVIRAADIHFDSFEDHKKQLISRCKPALMAEEEMLQVTDFDQLQRLRARFSRLLRKTLPAVRSLDFSLFTVIYADSYFGLGQAIEADALVRSINGRTVDGWTTRDQRRWLTVAIGRALLKIANSTGHFAQYLTPKIGSYKRFLAQRRRRLWSEWLFSIGELHPVGLATWRRSNKAFNEDSLVLIPRLRRRQCRPAVIYADPPYTDDQYSRFYHVLETLFLYDYPEVTGAGLYRPGRFSTPFSIKSAAANAFRRLIRASVHTGADLVLSYPTNGLLHDTGVDPMKLLKEFYPRVECCYSAKHNHSTFGASKGRVRAPVVERIYLARSPQ